MRTASSTCTACFFLVFLTIFSVSCGTDPVDPSDDSADDWKKHWPDDSTALRAYWERHDAAEADLRKLKTAVDLYFSRNNRLPENLEQLTEPDERNLGKPYLVTVDILRDPWGNTYPFISETTRHYGIKSLGADGLDGGEGINADIVTGFPGPSGEPRSSQDDPFEIQIGE